MPLPPASPVSLPVATPANGAAPVVAPAAATATTSGPAAPGNLPVETPSQFFWFKEHTEAIIALAGIAYAGGFFTVMVHTYRLGIPVVELVEPIYVWVGLPLAAAFVSLKFLLRTFQRQHQAILQEVSEIRRELMMGEQLSDEDWLRERIERIGALMRDVLPSLLGLLAFLWVRVMQQLVVKRALAKSQTVRLGAKERRHADRWLALIMAPMTLVIRYSSLTMYALLFPLCLYLYIADIYPWIPQGLGGGEPSEVRLVIAADKLSAFKALPNFFPANAVPAAAEPAGQEQAKTTHPVDLLFSTDKGYYIRTRSGDLVTLPADSVEGVIWLVPGQPEPPVPAK